ncbi:hypothetical protein ZIOFF_034015 [Zingiber officinale]|uniref:Uncharacterized protein n=1 Tax=Zingiber officinale TaxID=94328 RepID=A0A8J5GRL1_ZINOF|nr:hypothetical protein ZIOFF_034015 [Zingiber officinale]
MLQSRKPVPNLDQQSTKALNLTVLQRADAFVEEILLTATHVALYAFSVEINQWSRKEVEGSLFVVLRNTQPRFQFIVMNRRNADVCIICVSSGERVSILVMVAFARQIDADVDGNSNESKTGMRDWRGVAAKKVSTFSFLDLDLEGWSLEHSTLDPLPLPDQLTHIVEHGLGQNPSQDRNAASPINSVRQSPYLLALVEEGSMIL